METGHLAESSENPHGSAWAELFDRGRRAELDGRLDEARTSYASALESGGERADWRYRLGCVCLKQDDPAAAVPCFEAAAGDEATAVKALTNLGVCYDRLGRRTDAVRAYRLAIRRGGSAVAHHNLGSIHAEEGRPGEAIRSFEAAIALEPDAEAFLNLGLVHLAREDFVLAREAFDRSVDQQPRFALGHYHAALCHMKTGCYADACTRFDRAWELDPRLARTPYHLGVCCHKLQRYEEARAQFEQALEAFPEDGRIHYQLALTCDALGLHQEARTHYGRARAHDAAGR
ncbi:MAG: tetratricopeptide repeat protein [bacterium]|nr:tetratricopeptide repeat protein [bacterium]